MNAVHPVQLMIVAVMFAVGALAGCDASYGCPPSQQLNAGCQVQQFIAPQQVYAAPIVQRVVAQQYVMPQAIVLQQQGHYGQAIVQQVRQPRVQVQRQRVVIRSR